MPDDKDWMSWDGIGRIQDDIRDRLIGQGYEAGSMELFFAEKKEFEKALQAAPTMRERQERAGIFSKSKYTHLPLSEEQIAYLKDKLAGINDPVGISILAELDIRSKKSGAE